MSIKHTQISTTAALSTMRSVLLEMRLNEEAFSAELSNNQASTFFVNGHSDAIDRWNNNYTEFNHSLVQLQEQIGELPVLKAQAAAVSLKIQSYRELFYLATQKYQELGFRGSGAEGDLEAAHTYLSMLDDPKSAAVVKRLSALQALLLTRNKQTDRQTFDALIAELKKTVKGITAQQFKLIESYRASIYSIATLQQELGLTSEEGVRSQMSAVIQELGTSLTDIEGYFSQRTSHNFNLVSWVVVLAALVLIVLEGAIGYFLYHSITRPLQELTGAFDDLRQGKLGETVSIESNDEFGLIERAFNNMSLQLQKTYAALASSESRDEAILASIGQGIMVLNNDSKIISFNRAAGVLSGFSAEEVLGKPGDAILSFAFSPSSRPDTARQNYRVLLAKNGKKIPVQDAVTILKDKNGLIQGCVVAFHPR